MPGLVDADGGAATDLDRMLATSNKIMPRSLMFTAARSKKAATPSRNIEKQFVRAASQTT
jgi:hypothetical protein